MGASDRFEVEDVRRLSPALVVSHGYRRIVRPDVIDLLEGRIYNVHISLLPYGRGADPNLWSILDDTPSGVTVHEMDKGLDTGRIVLQSEVELDDSVDTLRTSYNRLQEEAVRLFAAGWIRLLAGEVRPVIQSGPGTEHRSTDKNSVLHLLEQGWDTPIKSLRGRAPR
ncbi:formyltransferase family protein [Pseudonocardia sp. McavD-2-B]|uniref:formyltransferase family protein n=1 Tax=Pseudonocardia sp. McavD-2-B TaxID=2954499 RepID=UPI0035AB88E7